MSWNAIVSPLVENIHQAHPISSIISIGFFEPLTIFQTIPTQPLTHQQFGLSAFLDLPFSQRVDLAICLLPHAVQPNAQQSLDIEHQIILMLNRLRDLFAKHVIAIALPQHQSLMRALGFTQLTSPAPQSVSMVEQVQFIVWQFNILNYKHVPDWFNSKFWANPEQWNKYRW